MSYSAEKPIKHIVSSSLYKRSSVYGQNNSRNIFHPYVYVKLHKQKEERKS